MLYLILSIISSSLIYIIFKLLDIYRIKIFPVIVLNYITAAFTGYFFQKKDFSFQEALLADWVYSSAFIGILFIATFYLIGISTQKAGITLTGISTKMSVVFPILFSIFYYNEAVFLLKITGIVLAVLSVVFSSIKDKKEQTDRNSYIFPVILFFSMGIVDSLVKYNQEEFLKQNGIMESTTVVFTVAAIVSFLVFVLVHIKKLSEIKKSSLFFGIVLGIANFGSLYFLILALNSNFLDSSVLFAINNSLIILISVLAGYFFFNEHLQKINWLGVVISIFAILALSI